MRVLDLFSGKGGFSSAFVERGHDLVTVDLDPAFSPTIVADVRRLEYPGLELRDPFDAVLASPPCNCFSVASIGRYWPDGKPEPEVAHAVALVARTLALVAQIRPRFWVLENPRGMLRTLIGPPRETIFLCAYGTPWKKPTDLWGTWPGRLRRPCAPHQAAPRGATGVVYRVGEAHQGGGITNPDLDAATRAEMPHALSLELCLRFEAALARSPVVRASSPSDVRLEMPPVKSDGGQP